MKVRSRNQRRSHWRGQTRKGVKRGRDGPSGHLHPESSHPSPFVAQLPGRDYCPLHTGGDLRLREGSDLSNITEAEVTKQWGARAGPFVLQPEALPVYTSLQEQRPYLPKPSHWEGEPQSEGSHSSPSSLLTHACKVGVLPHLCPLLHGGPER